MPPIVEFADGKPALEVGWVPNINVSQLIDTLPSSQRIRVHGALCDGEPVPRSFIIKPEHRITLLRLPSVLEESDRKSRPPATMKYDQHGVIESSRLMDSSSPALREYLAAAQAPKAVVPSPALPKMDFISRFLAANYLDEGSETLAMCDKAEARIAKKREQLNRRASVTGPTTAEKRAALLQKIPGIQLELMGELGFQKDAIVRMLLRNGLDAEEAANSLFLASPEEVEVLSQPLSDEEVSDFALKYLPTPAPPVVEDEAEVVQDDPGLSSLVNMGFDPMIAARALKHTNGNIEHACTLILEGRPIPAPTTPVLEANWRKQLEDILVKGSTEANQCTPDDVRRLIRALRANGRVDDIRRSDYGFRALSAIAEVFPKKAIDRGPVPARDDDDAVSQLSRIIGEIMANPITGLPNRGDSPQVTAPTVGDPLDNEEEEWTTEDEDDEDDNEAEHHNEEDEETEGSGHSEY